MKNGFARHSPEAKYCSTRAETRKHPPNYRDSRNTFFPLGFALIEESAIAVENPALALSYR